jgi:hypothetical protein
MKKLLFCFIIGFAGLYSSCFSQTVNIEYGITSLKQGYAAKVLKVI